MNKKTRKNPSALLFSLLIMLLTILSIPGFSFAQDVSPPLKQPANHQGWYQVEMIIFSRVNPALQEHFPTNIQLHYPTLWQTLKDPAALTVNPEQANVSTPTPVNPAPVIDFNSQPFYQLPSDMRQLNFQADKLARSSDYQLLFHQAWRQPINNKGQSDWILINAEKNSSQLSGSIRLSVATYLVLETNLWFAELEPKFDDTENLWPELPERPDLVAQDTLLPQDDNQQQEFTDSNESATTMQPKQIVLLKSKREMRSNEVHYIDHPLVGIVIKIVPFKSVAETTETTP